MSTDLIQHNKTTELDWHSQETLDELKSMYGKGLSETEWRIFIGIGRSTRLNPINREIWAYKFGSAPATIFIGRDGYRIAAFRNPNYSSHRVEAVYEKDTFTINEDGTYKHVTPNNLFVGRGELVGAYCMVKFRDRPDTIQVMVSSKEYKKTQSTWNVLPETMLKKVAEAQALRMAFPEQFNGTYHEYERPPSQTEVLKDKLGINEPNKIIDSQTGEVLDEAEDGVIFENEDNITIDQLTAIRDLMNEKNLSSERKQKALAQFEVDKIESLSSKNANTLISQLEKI